MNKKTTKKATKNNTWQTKATSPVEVTDVTLNWYADNSKSKVVALGTVTLNNCIKINISLVEGKDGLFVALPTHKTKDKYFSIVFISDIVVMNAINEAVIEAYEGDEDVAFD